jgi:hypothetical protein
VDHGSGGGVPASLPAAPPPQAVVVLDIVLWIMALVVGFLLHYLLPHLRKQTPWKCIAAPVLQSNEQNQYEVRTKFHSFILRRQILTLVDLLNQDPDPTISGELC